MIDVIPTPIPPLSPLALIKKVLTNRVGQIVVAVVATGIITAMFLPEKTVIKIETQVVYKDKIVEKEVIKYVDREVIKTVTVVEKVRVVKRKETWPDGHIIEDEIYESESEQVARVTEQEKEKYQQQLAVATKEFEQKETYLKETLNPHKFGIYGGAGVNLAAFKERFYVAGVQGQVWGPLMVGMEVVTPRGGAVTLGFRF